jgi:hypothetical protein
VLLTCPPLNFFFVFFEEVVNLLLSVYGIYIHTKGPGNGGTIQDGLFQNNTILYLAAKTFGDGSTAGKKEEQFNRDQKASLFQEKGRPCT